MKRIIGLFALAALLSVGTAWAQSSANLNYMKEIRTYAGNDSIYGGLGGLSTDSTVFTTFYPTNAAGVALYGGAADNHATVTLNSLDISNLWVPDFVESYMDSLMVLHTNGYYNFDAAASADVTHDSLSTYASAPTGFRVTAWVGSGAATTDTVFIWADVSMDEIGWYNIDKDYIEPSSGTAAVLLDDATTQDRSFNIAAGKLYGWKYLRFRVKGDGNHEAALAVRLYHYYRTYALPDWGEKMAP